MIWDNIRIPNYLICLLRLTRQLWSMTGQIGLSVFFFSPTNPLPHLPTDQASGLRIHLYFSYGIRVDFIQVSHAFRYGLS